MYNWKELIMVAGAGEEENDDFIIFCTLTEEQMLKKFNADKFEIEGCNFTAWSKKYVYFPTTYDGRERVAKVLRDPCNEATEHIGGDY